MKPKYIILLLVIISQVFFVKYKLYPDFKQAQKESSMAVGQVWKFHTCLDDPADPTEDGKILQFTNDKVQVQFTSPIFNNMIYEVWFSQHSFALCSDPPTNNIK